MLYPLSAPRISARLYKLADWLTSPRPDPVDASFPSRKSMQAKLSVLPKGRCPDGATLRGSRQTAPQRTLRVLRVVDAGQSRNAAGRIVISGRMADVCAELDRLAMRESAFI